MASLTYTETQLLDETEDHVASLLELLRAYEYGLRNAEQMRDRRLVEFLAFRVECTAERLHLARLRRDMLRETFQKGLGG